MWVEKNGIIGQKGLVDQINIGEGLWMTKVHKRRRVFK